MNTENTVILNLDEYNRLRDLDNNIKQGKKLVITNYLDYGGGSVINYYTDSEIAKNLTATNQALQQDIKKLKAKKEFTKPNITEPNPKEMGLWQLIKWRYDLK